MATDGHSPFGGPLFFPDGFLPESDRVLPLVQSSSVGKHDPSTNPNFSTTRDCAALQQPALSAAPTGPPPDGFSPVGSAQPVPLDGNPNLDGAVANPISAMVMFVPPKASPSASEETTQPKTYASASAPKQARPPPLFVNNLTAFNPVKRGNSTFLKMPEALYQKRLAAFAFALIGRIFLPKQATQRPLPDLKSELQILFKTEEDWSLNPLGKGFYSLKFSSQADQSRAARFSSWRLKEGSFNIREWKPNFDPYKENTSVTQVWVRLFHLPEEYWEPDFLVGIFRAVGNVVKLDGSTAHGMVGHFARALVEVDLNFPLAESVTIEGVNTSFDVEFGFENLPLFCSFCKYIGHAVNDCRNRKKSEADLQQPVDAATGDAKQGHNPRRRNRNRNRGQWMKKDQPTQPNNGNVIPTHNPFDALDNEEDAKPVEAAPKSAPVSTSNAFAAFENDSSSDPVVAAAATTVRELVPLSAEAAAALNSIAGRDYTLHNPETENVLSSDDVEEEEIQADFPPKTADGSQPESSELAEGLELSPKEMPSTMTPADMDETTTVVPPQVASHKMSAAAKRRTKEALRKGRVRSTMKTRSSFDISSDTLHVLADKRRRSAQVSANSVGQPHGVHPHPKGAQLDDKLRIAMEQGKCPKAYVVGTGQSVKAMGLIANQKWGDVLDLAVSDKDFFDFTS